MLRRYCQSEAASEGLRLFASEGAYARLLDSASDGLRSERFSVFEMGHLLRSSAGAKLSVPVLLYLFHAIERRLDRGVPSLIVIEEAWLPLLNSRFARQIEDWLRGLAKLNCGVYLVTQSPEEVLATEHRKAVLDSCATRFWLPPVLNTATF